MRRYVSLAAVSSVIACSHEKPVARPDPAPLAAPSPSPTAPPSPSIAAAPDEGAANDASAPAAARPLRCIDGQMVASEDPSEEMGLGASTGFPADPGPLKPGAKPKNSGLGGLGQGNVRGTIVSTKDLTNDEANSALCPSMKKVLACVLALAASRKDGVRSDEELEVTVVSGAVKSVKSTSAPLPPELAAIVDKQALKCSIDGSKSAAFSTGSGVVRYRVEIDVSGAKGPKTK